MAKKRKSVRKKKKSRKRGSHFSGLFKVIIILFCIAVGAVFLSYYFGHKDVSGIKSTKHRTIARRGIKLYIADGEALKGIKRSIKKGPLRDEVKETWKILLWADSGTLIPRGSRLINVEIKNNTAYLSISSALRDKHPGGTSAEMQTIYAIVNSITLNYKKIKYVKILINGKTETTLAGHIDISAPLGPYRGIITDS